METTRDRPNPPKDELNLCNSPAGLHNSQVNVKKADSQSSALRSPPPHSSTHPPDHKESISPTISQKLASMQELISNLQHQVNTLTSQKHTLIGLLETPRGIKRVVNTPNQSLTHHKPSNISSQNQHRTLQSDSLENGDDDDNIQDKDNDDKMVPHTKYYDTNTPNDNVKHGDDTIKHANISNNHNYPPIHRKYSRGILHQHPPHMDFDSIVLDDNAIEERVQELYAMELSDIYAYLGEKPPEKRVHDKNNNLMRNNHITNNHIDKSGNPSLSSQNLNTDHNSTNNNNDTSVSPFSPQIPLPHSPSPEIPASSSHSQTDMESKSKSKAHNHIKDQQDSACIPLQPHKKDEPPDPQSCDYEHTSNDNSDNVEIKPPLDHKVANTSNVTPPQYRPASAPVVNQCDGHDVMKQDIALADTTAHTCASSQHIMYSDDMMSPSSSHLGSSKRLSPDKNDGKSQSNTSQTSQKQDKSSVKPNIWTLNLNIDFNPTMPPSTRMVSRESRLSLGGPSGTLDQPRHRPLSTLSTSTPVSQMGPRPAQMSLGTLVFTVDTYAGRAIMNSDYMNQDQRPPLYRRQSSLYGREGPTLSRPGSYRTGTGPQTRQNISRPPSLSYPAPRPGAPPTGPRLMGTAVQRMGVDEFQRMYGSPSPSTLERRLPRPRDTGRPMDTTMPRRQPLAPPPKDMKPPRRRSISNKNDWLGPHANSPLPVGPRKGSRVQPKEPQPSQTPSKTRPMTTRSSTGPSPSGRLTMRQRQLMLTQKPTDAPENKDDHNSADTKTGPTRSNTQHDVASSKIVGGRNSHGQLERIDEGKEESFHHENAKKQPSSSLSLLSSRHHPHPTTQNNQDNTGRNEQDDYMQTRYFTGNPEDDKNDIYSLLSPSRTTVKFPLPLPSKEDMKNYTTSNSDDVGASFNTIDFQRQSPTSSTPSSHNIDKIQLPLPTLDRKSTERSRSFQSYGTDTTEFPSEDRARDNIASLHPIHEHTIHEDDDNTHQQHKQHRNKNSNSLNRKSQVDAESSKVTDIHTPRRARPMTSPTPSPKQYNLNGGKTGTLYDDNNSSKPKTSPTLSTSLLRSDRDLTLPPLVPKAGTGNGAESPLDAHLHPSMRQISSDMVYSSKTASPPAPSGPSPQPSLGIASRSPTPVPSPRPHLQIVSERAKNRDYMIVNDNRNHKLGNSHFTHSAYPTNTHYQDTSSQPSSQSSSNLLPVAPPPSIVSDVPSLPQGPKAPPPSLASQNVSESYMKAPPPSLASEVSKSPPIVRAPPPSLASNSQPIHIADSIRSYPSLHLPRVPPPSLASSTDKEPIYYSNQLVHAHHEHPSTSSSSSNAPKSFPYPSSQPRSDQILSSLSSITQDSTYLDESRIETNESNEKHSHTNEEYKPHMEPQVRLPHASSSSSSSAVLLSPQPEQTYDNVTATATASKESSKNTHDRLSSQSESIFNDLLDNESTNIMLLSPPEPLTASPSPADNYRRLKAPTTTTHSNPSSHTNGLENIDFDHITSKSPQLLSKYGLLSHSRPNSAETDGASVSYQRNASQSPYTLKSMPYIPQPDSLEQAPGFPSRQSSYELSTIDDVIDATNEASKRASHQSIEPSMANDNANQNNTAYSSIIPSRNHPNWIERGAQESTKSLPAHNIDRSKFIVPMHALTPHEERLGHSRNSYNMNAVDKEALTQQTNHEDGDTYKYVDNPLNIRQSSGYNDQYNDSTITTPITLGSLQYTPREPINEASLKSQQNSRNLSVTNSRKQPNTSFRETSPAHSHSNGRNESYTHDTKYNTDDNETKISNRE